MLNYPRVLSVTAAAQPLQAWLVCQYTAVGGDVVVELYAEPVVGMATIDGDESIDIVYLVNDRNDGAPVPLPYLVESSMGSEFVATLPPGESPSDEAVTDAKRLLRTKVACHDARVARLRAERQGAA